MRIATRLVLALGLAVAAIMAVYALITQQQREALLRAALVRETGTLARSLQIVANSALRDGRVADLNRVLEQIASNPETFVSAVIDEQGRLLAGGVDDPECLRRSLPLAGPGNREQTGWADCEGEVHWVVLPAQPPAAAVILARRATVLEREIAITRKRHFFLALVLITTAALAILLVLGRTLSQPLEEIMRGIRSLDEPGGPVAIRVPASGGELSRLATAFNEMAAQLEMKQRSLLHGVEERIALERRLAQSEKFALMGRVSGGLAHELGSPLGVIAIRADTIASTPDVPPAVRENAELILAEVDRIVQFVRGLLHIARRHGIDAQPLDLAALLRAAIDHLAPAVESAAVNLELGTPTDPVTIRGQAALLRHAILNVIRNAVHALAEHDGVRRVHVQLLPAPERVRIIVEDTGPGIPPEHLPHVFEPFFTTKGPGEGTGLGLAISRGIAEEHGGELQLEPRDGGGMRATFDLPVNGPSAPLNESP